MRAIEIIQREGRERPALLRVEEAQRALAACVRVDEAKKIKDQADAIKVYLRSQKAGREATDNATEIVFRASRRMGELLIKQAKLKKRAAAANGRPKKGSMATTLSSQGITPDESKNAQDMARAPAEKFEKCLRETKANVTEKLTKRGFLRALKGTEDYDSDECYTPAQYVAAARQVLGEIDLDPFSCVEAQKVVGAKAFFSKRDDAFARPWLGRLFVNWPYSINPECCEKFLLEVAAGNVAAAIVLVNNDTDTVWFHDLLARFPVCFTGHPTLGNEDAKGRISFVINGKPASGNRQGQAFFYHGDNPRRFAEVFSNVGTVMQRVSLDGEEPP